MACYEPCRKSHSNDEWKKFTLLDFIRILGLSTDGLKQVISVDNSIEDGRYIQFVGYINRLKEVLPHLHCRSCNKLLLPVESANYNAYAVTLFQCFNNNCEDKTPVYITHCMNGYCNAIIDDRDLKKCPNGWCICDRCVSCCDKEMGVRGEANARYFGEYIAKKWQITIDNPHNPDKYFCPKCGSPMAINDEYFSCNKCNITYIKRTDDFKREVKGLIMK